MTMQIEVTWRWTPEREAAAQTLFNAGASASESAANLSREFGLRVSRNAVIGKWHRRGWCGRSRQLKQSKTKKQEPRQASQLAKRVRVNIIEAPPAPKPEQIRMQRLISAAHGSMRVIDTIKQTLAPLLEVAVTPLHLNLLDLQPGQCRYPFGDSSFTFCGCPAVPEKPYCAPHQHLCCTEPSIHQNRSNAQRQRRERERTSM